MVEGSFRPTAPTKKFYKSANETDEQGIPIIPPRPQMAPKLPLKQKSTKIVMKPTESTVYPREDNIYTGLRPLSTLFQNASSNSNSSTGGLPIDFNIKCVICGQASIIGLNQGRAALITNERRLVISEESFNRQLYELIEIEGLPGEFLAFQDAGNVLKIKWNPREQSISTTLALRSCIPLGTCKILMRPEVGEIWVVGMREITILMVNKEGEVAVLRKGISNCFQDSISIYFIGAEDLVSIQLDRTIKIYSIARFDHKPALIAKLPTLIGDLIRVFKLDSKSFATVYADGKIVLWRQDHEGNVKEKISIAATLFRIQSAVKIGEAIWLGLVNGKIMVIQLMEGHVVVPKIVSETKFHSNSISKLMVSLKDQLASIDSTGQICIWDSSLSLYKQNLSLWSREADYCRYERVSARICSWNVAAQSPIDCDRSILLEWIKGADRNDDIKEDFLVISLQEIVDLNAKSLLISGSGNGSGNGSSQAVVDQWAKLIKMCLNKDFELVHCSAMVGLGLIIFSRSCLRSAVSSVSEDSVKTGLGGLHGNKGGLCWRAFIHNLPVAFVACHLAAGQAAINERNSDFATIVRSATFSSEMRDPYAFPTGNSGNRLFDHSVVIVAGDLNYRIELDRIGCLDRIEKGEKDVLRGSDQLAQQMRRQELLLSYFREEQPDFAPTYKYDRGTIDRFDSSEKARTPAWCDRILYYTKVPESVTVRAYKSIQEAILSDHKPIYSVIELKCPRIDPVSRENLIKNFPSKHQ